MCWERNYQRSAYSSGERSHHWEINHQNNRNSYHQRNHQNSRDSNHQRNRQRNPCLRQRLRWTIKCLYSDGQNNRTNNQQYLSDEGKYGKHCPICWVTNRAVGGKNSWSWKNCRGGKNCRKVCGNRKSYWEACWNQRNNWSAHWTIVRKSHRGLAHCLNNKNRRSHYHWNDWNRSWKNSPLYRGNSCRNHLCPWVREKRKYHRLCTTWKRRRR